MGLLSEGVPLSWEKTKALAEHVRVHGAKQFVNLYKRLQYRKGDPFKFGDEVEYMILKLDDEQERVQVSTRAHELLKELQQPELEGRDNLKSLWRPEFGSYMVESSPGSPYGPAIDDFNEVEKNMQLRREQLEGMLEEDEIIVTMSSFPTLGCPDFTYPKSCPDPANSFTKSLFWPDKAICQSHPRFKNLSRNIYGRRGEKVAINVPIYKDVNTAEGYLEDLSQIGDADGSSRAASRPNHIYMDETGFGLGLCCLQVTFQASNLSEAEMLYDQLAPLCPILLALTASSPMFRGYLADVDCRWDVISASTDCRTREERAKGGIPKSRYDSISSYISKHCENFQYNDIELKTNDKVYKMLKDNGINELMAQHIGHLFIRDTVSLFSEKVNQNDDVDTDHFENIQSTNWQTMRFKPPPPNSKTGWRVEIRPCELQFTDFENAAIVCFIGLLTRAILSFGCDLLMPISKVDINMKRAQKRDSILEQKFFFRVNITSSYPDNKEPIIEEMTIDQIINGDPNLNYLGLLPLIQEYLRDQEVSSATMFTLENYWKLIQMRSSGEVKTNARFMRDFVLNHPEYRQDSVVSERISYDLIKEVQKTRIRGESSCPELRSTCYHFDRKIQATEGDVEQNFQQMIIDTQSTHLPNLN